MMRILALVLLTAFVACNGDGPPPQPPPTTTTTIPPPPPPPPLNTHFKWELARGFSLFSGARATDSQIRNLYDTYRARWPNLRLTARVCGELQSWPFVSEDETPDEPKWLPRGVTARPFDETAPAYKELKHFLDVAVTIPDAQVLVVPICNLKGDGTKPINRLKWVRSVCRLVGSDRIGDPAHAAYPNVAIEVVNEYIHPNSNITTEEMLELINVCRAEAPATSIGTDTNINKRRREYDPTLKNVVDYFSYHPWRNPDPTKDDLRAIVRDLIGGTVFSETTAYAHPKWGRLGGCCTSDEGQIVDYARNAEKSGGVFFFHSVWGLCWPAENCPMDYIPPRGDWEIRHGR